ncbi:beta strand repeat-containing protein [Anabaena catenula]|uniref:M10 family metallopeptidase C-terminal domain-containing protein n=1 Tax=Anabaena catenula FACHB-362 TaxID=2692877 RepID=A0ABR8J5D4_9NOST|nr:Calx-beta domain-containing protein [Anabaena catenula]MBD2693563.1 M10 family metallopeptidase C-terminal domain-containing protein [Anabaena catenula FACHB-362]
MINATWQPILKSALAKLRKFARHADFDTSLKQVFGADIQTGELQQAWLAGKFGTLPKLEIIASSQINGALGAFAATTNTIYLSSELIKTDNLTVITEVFLEEYGHYLDNKLNQQDRAGDEGEYFAAVVTGKTLSLSDITRLQTENDKVVVTLAGQAVEIEQSTLPFISVGTTPSNANENNTPGGFILTRSGDFSSSLTINYGISGTAINGTDYSNLSGSVTFAAGSATATVVVNPLDDGLYEGTETVTLTLVSGTTYIADPDDDITATLNIADNELVVVNQLTFLAYNSAAQISGNNVVWSGFDGTDDEIFFYNGTSTIQLTNNSSYEYGVHISGNNVVWYSHDGTDYEIYLYNGTSTIQLTNNSSYDDYPQISGNNVVWSGYDVTDHEIYLYNGTSTISLTNNSGDDRYPQISGNNVVWQQDDGTGNNEIYLYNGTSTIQLTNNSYDDNYPQISGNNVVWSGYDGTTRQLYLYNGTSTIQLTNYSDNSSVEISSPQISGNNVVWTGYDGTDSEIYLYNGTSTIQLTNNSSYDHYPQISGNNVVWTSYDGNDNEIYLYNGTSTIQLSNDSYDDNYPEISGNNVVWKSLSIISLANIDPKPLPIITVAATDANAGETLITGTPNPGVFTLTRTASDVNPTVNYTITGTAANGIDYLQLTGTATFARGSTTTTITVTPTDDFIFEGNETVILTLATGTGYNLGTAKTATVTIADNDAIPQLSINDVIITEGNSGTKNANFIISLSNPRNQTISVNYQTVDDDATTANNDYVAKTGTITFTPGQTTQTLPITINGDTVGEINEAFTVLLSNAVNATLVKNEGVGIIKNDDLSLPSVTVTPIYTQANESGVPGIFQLNRTGSTTKSLNINYSLSGTATNGTDYSSLTGTATFAAGNNTAIIFVTPTEDIFYEGNETAILNLLTGTGYTVGASNSSTITIADNESQPQLTINDVTLTEGNSGTKTANFAVTFSNPSTKTITVAYQTSNISATAGSDYVAKTGTITFNPGETSKTVSVVINGDTVVEADETFKVTLNTPVNATIADGEGIGTITNDEVPTLAVNNVTVVEGLDSNAIVTFTLSSLLSQAVSVNYTTTAGTAAANSDYTAVSGTLTIPANTASATVSIPIINNTTNEVNETFNLVLSNPVGVALSNTKSIITITDTLQSSTTVTLPAGVENLQLIGTAAINGTGNTANNILTGNIANNILAGGDGNDIYRFTATTVLGSDTIQETATGGIDTIDFTGTTAATTLNLGLTTIQTVVTTNLSLKLSANNVMENVIGGNGADNFTGNVLDNSLMGGLGNDNLRGGDGADSLTGSAGNDILAGNAGNDKLIYSSGKVFTATDIGLDTILDFTVGSDKIVLSKATFKSLLSVAGNGFSQAAEFAVVADDSSVDTQAAFIVYSSGSGNLFYNQNGITAGLGTGAAFANLFNIPATLTAGDFAVVV